MNKALLSLFLVSLVAGLALAGWTLHVFRTDLPRIIDIKTALFTAATDARADFSDPPSTLIRRGFATDDRERIAAWRERLRAESPYVAAIDEEALPEATVERAKAISLLFSKNGDDACGASGLMENVERVPRGEGCCSDHSEVFLALTSILGVQARETRQTHHTHNEIFDPASKRWIWIDPQFALLARGGGGRYLSLIEMRDHYLEGRPVDFEFFGTEDHDLAHKSPHDEPIYSGPDELREIYIVMGNNVFEQEDFRARLAVLPKPVWQLAGMLVGPVPGFVILSDARTTRPDELRRMRDLAVTSVLAIGVGLLAYPLHRMAHARRRAPRPREASSEVAEKLCP